MKRKPARTPAADQNSGPFWKRHGDVLWFAALAVILLVLLHESLFTGKGLVPADAMLNASPWKQPIHPSNILLADQYRVFLPTQEFIHQQKSLPLWNPNLCCGVPNLGAIQGALFFPIRVLLSPLDPFSASGPAAFIKLCLAGWFTLLYVRLLGVSCAGAFLAGLVFSLSGFMIVWLGHPHVNTAMWLPLLLYLIEKSFRYGPGQALGAPALRVWAGFAITFACMILGGHPPTAIHVMIFVLIYFLIRLVAHRRDQPLTRSALLAASVAAGLLLAAPQILPFLEYNRESSSALASASLNRWSSHFSFSSLIHFLLPNALGNPALGHDDLEDLLGWHPADNFNERTGYVGILPLFLAAYAIGFRRCNFTKIFASLAVGSLLVMGGVPPFPGILRELPVLRDINQTRLLLVLGFSVAVLAALGWDAFTQKRTWRRGMIVAAGFSAVVLAAFLYFWRTIGPQVHALDPAHWDFLRGQFLILAGGLAVTAFLSLSPMRWNSWIPTVVCMGWTAVDLLCFATGYNPAISRDLYYPPTPAIEWLQKDASQFRIFGAPSILAPDSAEVFGLNDARGCDYMTVRRYEEFVTGKAGDFFFYEYPGSIPASLALLNVKYILSTKEFPPNSILELVYSKEILIYRVKDSLDRALLLYDYQVEPDKTAILTRVSAAGFDPGKVLLLEDQPVPAPRPREGSPAMPAKDGTVHMVSYEPDDVKIEATLPRPGFLLLLDTYFPGWSATVNGQPAPILRADYNFRAISLPEGKSIVRFSYCPGGLKIGLCLCGIGVLALCGAWFRPWEWKS